MSRHKKDLERHPALSKGGILIHEVIIVADETRPGRAALFIDGKEILLSADHELGASFGPDSLPTVSITLLAETVNVISWDEMESRAY